MTEFVDSEIPQVKVTMSRSLWRSLNRHSRRERGMDFVDLTKANQGMARLCLVYAFGGTLSSSYEAAKAQTNPEGRPLDVVGSSLYHAVVDMLTFATPPDQPNARVEVEIPAPFAVVRRLIGRAAAPEVVARVDWVVGEYYQFVERKPAGEESKDQK